LASVPVCKVPKTVLPPLLLPVGISMMSSSGGREPFAGSSQNAGLSPAAVTAVLSETAGTAPTQRDQHLQCIADKGRIGWQKVSGYTKRSRVEAAIGRYKQVIGDGLRFHKDERRTTEVGVAVHVLNRMLEMGRPISVRIP
jgi:hypothetical protein